MYIIVRFFFFLLPTIILTTSVQHKNAHIHVVNIKYSIVQCFVQRFRVVKSAKRAAVKFVNGTADPSYMRLHYVSSFSSYYFFSPRTPPFANNNWPLACPSYIFAYIAIYFIYFHAYFRVKSISTRRSTVNVDIVHV